MVEPAAIAADPQLHTRFVEVTEAALQGYAELLDGLQATADSHLPAGSQLGAGKQARQAARAVLPNATETKLV